MENHREISGAFCVVEAKWQELWTQLASSDCAISSLRIYHNTPAQLQAAALALLNNSSVTQLDVGVVEGEAASTALQQLLQGSRSIQHLVIQELHDAATIDAAAPAPAAAQTSAAAASPPSSPAPASPVFQGLACNRSIRTLVLHKLQPQQVLQLASALAAGGCGGALQQLNLPGARLDAAAAAALSAALCSQPQLIHLGLKGAAFMCQHKLCQQQQQQQQQSLSAAEHDAGHPASLSPGCAAAQLFTAALAAHPSLTHVTLQAAAVGCTGTPSCHASAAAGSGGSNACTACWQSIGVYAAAAQRLQELVLSEAGLGDVGARQLGAGLAQAAAAAAAGTAAWQAAFGAEHTGTQLASGTTRASGCGIRLLDLSSNGLGAEGAEGAAALGLSCAALKVLKLGSNQLGAEGVSRFVKGLLAATGTGAASSTLRQHGDAVTAAAAGGGGCMQLQELDLSGNGIADAAGLQQLLNSPLGAGLLSLDLSHNCLDDKAAQLLAAALVGGGGSSNHPQGGAASEQPSSSVSQGCGPGRNLAHLNLAHLNLAHNWIKDEGGKALAALLHKPSSSTDNNSSRPSSPQAVVGSPTGSSHSSSSSSSGSGSSLSVLLLHHNRMSRAALELLADAAVGNRRVLDLQLQGNRAVGRLQALEDLKLVLADRRHKLQSQLPLPPPQQQPEQRQSQPPPQQQQQQQGTVGVVLEDDTAGTAPAVAAASSGSGATPAAAASTETGAAEAAAAAAAAGAAGAADATARIYAGSNTAGAPDSSRSSSSKASAVPTYLQKAAAAVGVAMGADKNGPAAHRAGMPVSAAGAAPGSSNLLPLFSGSGSISSAAALQPQQPGTLEGSGQLTFRLPSLAGRFLKRQQQQQGLGLGRGEESFSFDQWCEDNALQLECWGSIGGGSSSGSSNRGSRGPHAAVRGSASGPRSKLQPAAAAAAINMTDAEAGCEACIGAAAQGTSDGGTNSSSSSSTSGCGQAEHLLLDAEGEEEEEGPAGAPAGPWGSWAGTWSGRVAGVKRQADSATTSTAGSNGQLLAGEGLDGFDQTTGFATGLVGAAVASGLDDSGSLPQPVGLQAVHNSVGRVSSLSGWMSQEGFQARQELLLLPPGVRRRYVFVHGPFDSSSGSSREPEAGPAALTSFGSAGTALGCEGMGSPGGTQQAASSGVQACGGGSSSSSDSGRAAASDSRGGRAGRLVLCSASRDGGSGVLQLRPKASAASLRSFGSSDGGSGSSSRSSSIGGDGSNSSSERALDSHGSRGVLVIRQGAEGGGALRSRLGLVGAATVGL